MSARVPWIALGGAGMLAMGALGAQLLARGLVVAPCPFKALTSLPCATCGGTRCVMALWGGRWAEAFHWHPVLVLALLAAPGAMAWDLLRAWRAKPYPGLPEAPAWRWGAAALLVGTWALQILRGI